MSTPSSRLGWRAPRPAATPREPSPRALAQLNAVMRWSGWAGRLALRRWVENVEVQGLQHLAQGPMLVMSNHSCVFDPLLLTIFGRRPIQFLVTEPFMSSRAGSAASWWGQIPKRKLESDAHSFRLLKAWGEHGAALGLFPEGQFPWDSRPLPLQPGLPQLVSYLGVPVVTARVINADRLWPQWATYPRRTTVRIEVDAPHTFKPGDAIEAAVKERIFVDPDTCVRWPARGRDLAAGLARFLRYCLACGTDHSLVDSGDELRCDSCRVRWQVSADNRLVADGVAISIADARARAEAHWRTHWARESQFRSLGAVDVLDISRAEVKRLAHGALTLTGGRLSVSDGPMVQPWTLGLDEILAHTLDWGDRIVIRTPRARLAIRIPRDSRALWTLALDTVMPARRKSQS